MYLYQSAWKSRSRHFFVAVLASAAVFTAGCANMATTGVVSDSLPGTGTAAAAISGHVHGGNQPISNALVTVNFAGAAGNGSAGSVVATVRSSHDGTGSFSFTKVANDGVTTYPSTGSTYTCPAAANIDPLVYIMAKGGNTQNSSDVNLDDSAIVFLAPLGRCKEINTNAFLNITEVTTVATIAALQQYIDPVAEVIGADSVGNATTALSNSFNLINNLVSMSGGNAVTSTTFTGGGLNLDNGVSQTVAGTPPVTTGVSVTATPETAKINTIANIIAACVNGTAPSNAPCVTLFQSAVPPTYSTTARPGSGPFPTATDVLQAAYYMFTNPTNTTPTDASDTNRTALYNIPVGIGAPFLPALTGLTPPTDWTIGITYSSSSTCFPQSTTPAIAPGTGGFINSPTSLSVDGTGNIWIADSQAGSGNLSEITATGIPVTCVAMNANSTSTHAVSTIIDNPNSGYNVWQGSADSSILSRYTPTTARTILNFTLPEPPTALAADGIGNVYFSTALGNLYQIPNGANISAAVSPVLISSNAGFVATGLFIDNATTTPQTGAIWMTSGSTQISRTVPSTGNTFTTTTFNTASPTYGIAIGAVNGGGSNNIVVDSSTASAIMALSGSGTSYSSITGGLTSSGLGGNTPTGIALDGKSNIWLANNAAVGGFDSVSEVSFAGNSLSSSTGFQKPASYLNNSRSLVIDMSGNVWVGGDGNAFITEIVGAAVPVWQPFANGLSASGGNRFQQIP